MSSTVSIRFAGDSNIKLNKLSQITKRPKSFFIKEAVEKYLEEMEDIYISLDRIANPDSKYISTEALLSMLEENEVNNIDNNSDNINEA